jgi:hypothetical protein
LIGGPDGHHGQLVCECPALKSNKGADGHYGFSHSVICRAYHVGRKSGHDDWSWRVAYFSAINPPVYAPQAMSWHASMSAIAHRHLRFAHLLTAGSGTD